MCQEKRVKPIYKVCGAVPGTRIGMSRDDLPDPWWWINVGWSPIRTFQKSGQFTWYVACLVVHQQYDICVKKKTWGCIIAGFQTYFENTLYPLVNKHSNGISQFLIGNTSSIRVHFPASYVRLPECSLPNILWLWGSTPKHLRLNL